MNIWFECRIRYDKMTENGSVKKANDIFMVEAMSFTEAEARIIEEQTPFISGDFTIPAIKKTNVAEIFYCEGCDKWWSVKYNIIIPDERSGRERRTPVYVLVQADTQQEATDNFNAGMKGTMADYEIVEVAETKIMDVYPCQPTA